jgi:hypothetical protein
MNGPQGAQSARDLSDGLPQPLRVLDQGEAEEAFSGLTEASPWTHSDVGNFQQFHGEVDRAGL